MRKQISPDKIKLEFIDSYDGSEYRNRVTITLSKLLDSGTPIDNNGFDMDFLEATIEDQP